MAGQTGKPFLGVDIASYAKKGAPMRLAGDLLFYVTFIGYVSFCVLFTRSHWWRTAIGRHIFAFMFVPTVLMGLGAFRRLTLAITGSAAWFDAHRDELVFWSYAAMAAVVWWRFIILIIAQKFQPEKAMVRSDQRVIVEGEHQTVIIEDPDDMDPRDERSRAFD
jgi:hypothetical protein